MPVLSVSEFVQALQKNQILEADHAQELASLQRKYKQSKALANEMLQRGWLTAFQVNLLLQGRCAELVAGDNILLERLGAGGAGAVFKARQRSLERIIAVKMIRKEQVGNATALLRFQQEARIAARLSHPNIVAVHEAGEAAGGHYLAMEFIDGTDLAKRVKERGPLPIASACECIRQAALGLQHAHEQGMVHRDIKPHNLLLKTPHPPDIGGQGASHGTRSVPATSPPLAGGQGGVVKILDMGLARLGSAAEESSATAGLTARGTIVGTVDYMASEQAGDSRKVDIRADIYSLGCTFYFLLTGRVPFPGGDVLGKLIKHRLEEPAALERLRPDVPPAVVAVVRKMTAKDPRARYQTPVEAARALAPLVLQYRKSKPAGSTGILPVSAGSTGILPVPAGSTGILPVSAGSTGILPVSAGSTGILPVSVSSTGILPVSAGSTGILPVSAGSTGILPVQHRLAAGATSEQTPTDEELSYTLSAELSGRDTHIDRPGRGGAALTKFGRLTRWTAALWWRGVTQGSRRKRLVVAALTLLVPLLLWAAWPGDKRAGPVEKPSPAAKIAAGPVGKPSSGIKPAAGPVEKPSPAAKIEKNAKIEKEPPAESEKYLTNSIGMNFALIPAGEFTMGSPAEEAKRQSNEGPRHKVKIIKPFYLGVYEVKQSEYEKVTGTNPSKFKGGKNPVEMVSWEEAAAFCKKLSALPEEKRRGLTYRLPTEAEWEYACRGGKTTVFHCGDALSSEQANIDGNHPYGGAAKGKFLGRTAEVGSYPPNVYDLYDMHGNVWEWCGDGPRGYTSDSVEDPRGPEGAGDLRVLRGGGWNHEAWDCRCAKRYPYKASDRYNSVGFRVVLIVR